MTATTRRTDDDHLAYWREQYRHEPYYRPGHDFAYYEVAYRIGWQARDRHAGRSFDECENELREEYERNRGASPLTWDETRDAVKAAWHRLDRVFPDSD